MMNRRELLWMSMLASHTGLISRKGLRARFPGSFWDDPQSPPTTPFVRPLPFPLPPRVAAPFQLDPDCNLFPLASGGSPSPRLSRRGMNAPVAGPEIRFHRMVEEERFVELHPDLPLTPVWRYRDAEIPATAHGDAFGEFVAGPTIVSRWQTPMALRVFNDLPEDHVGFGVNHTTVHYHGGHVEARSDGFPEQGHDPNPTFDPIFRPGESYDYCYEFQDIGFTHGEPTQEERPATQWYHDHLLDFTGPNVYRGLAGFLLVFDELDAGDENLMTPENLRLPSFTRPDGSLPGFDIPLVLADRLIAPDGTLVYLPEDFDGFIGDKILVNGRIQPFFEVEPRKYRFRILIGTNARMFVLNVITDSGQPVPVDVIANGGGLFAAPVRDFVTETDVLAPAMRRDIVVDFSQFPIGARLYLEDILLQDEDGRGPDGDFEEPDVVGHGDGRRILEFRVVPGTGVDNSQVPDALRPRTPIPQSELDAATRRHFEFERGNGAWQINGEFVDLDRPVAMPRLNQPEIWTLENGGGGWWHPIHIHSELVRVLSRNGEEPGPFERDGLAEVDTVNLAGGDEVEVFVKFRDHPGPWVMHCHNIEHEDHFMMVRFDVIE